MINVVCVSNSKAKMTFSLLIDSDWLFAQRETKACWLNFNSYQTSLSNNWAIHYGNSVYCK